MPDIKTRFVLEGESQFRSAMTNAATAVKTLNAEQKLAQAQFKATGDEESYMAAQTRILQKRLDEQKKAVEAAGNALSTIDKNGGRGSKTWDTWNMKLLNAQTAVANTEAEIKKLGSTMDTTETSTTGLETSLSNVEKHTDFSAVIQGINKITSSIEKAAKRAFSLAKGLYSAEYDASVWADDLLTKSTAYGIDTETLQRWEYAAQFVDTEVDTVLKARDKLTKAKGTKGGGEILDILGIDPEGLSTMDLFWETLNRLQDAGDNQEEWSQELFGKSFRDLMPLLQAGREEWEKWAGEAPVVSDENVKNLGEANDAINKMNSTLETTKLEMLSALAPAFTDLANALTSFVNSEEGQKVISDITNMLSEGLQWVVDNKDAVVIALGAIGTAFAGLKISEGVLTFVNASNGLKNLLHLGGDGNNTGSPKVPTTPSTSPGTNRVNLPSWLGPAAILGGGAVGMWNLFWDKQEEQGRIAEQLYAADAAQSAEVASYSNQYSDAYSVLETYRDMLANAEEVAPVMEEIAKSEDFLSAARLAGFEGTDWSHEGWLGWINLIGDDTFGGIFGQMMDSLKQKAEEAPPEVPVNLDPDKEALQTDLSQTTFSAPLVLNPKFSDMAQMMVGFPHANGLDYVPYNGYPAILHRGERVLTRSENEAYSHGSYSIDDVTRAVTYALGSVGIYMGSDQVGNLTTNRVSNNIAKRSNAKLRSRGG